MGKIRLVGRDRRDGFFVSMELDYIMEWYVGILRWMWIGMGMYCKHFTEVLAGLD